MQGSRWLKTNADTNVPPGLPRLDVSRIMQAPLTEAQRYVKGIEVTKRMNSLLTSCGTEVFKQRMAVLLRIVNHWENCPDASLPADIQTVTGASLLFPRVEWFFSKVLHF